MNNYVCQSPSAGATAALAERLASHLTQGGTILLQGELGAGKTTFVQGLARALGVIQSITSPTFVVVQTYPTRHAVIQQLVHVDLYRITEEQQLTTLDLAHFASTPGTLVVVEWPERTIMEWPELLGTIQFTLGELDHRQLSITGLIADFFN